jgi:hypothetical protein
MTVVCWLCVHHPNLTDVWTNHLLPFLLPNVLFMRKHLAIALYELRHRLLVIAMAGHTFVSSDLDLNERYWSYWLDEHLVVIRRYGFLDRHLLHLSVTGVVHCSTRVRIGRSFEQEIICRDVTVNMGAEHILYYMQIPHHLGAWGWRQIVRLPQTSDICLKRAVVLHDIRTRNR